MRQTHIGQRTAVSRRRSGTQGSRTPAVAGFEAARDDLRVRGADCPSVRHGPRRPAVSRCCRARCRRARACRGRCWRPRARTRDVRIGWRVEAPLELAHDDPEERWRHVACANARPLAARWGRSSRAGCTRSTAIVSGHVATCSTSATIGPRLHEGSGIRWATCEYTAPMSAPLPRWIAAPTTGHAGPRVTSLPTAGSHHQSAPGHRTRTSPCPAPGRSRLAGRRGRCGPASGRPPAR